MTPLNDHDLPALFLTADAASLSGQRWFVCLFRLSLIALVIASAASAFDFTAPEPARIASGVSLLFFLISSALLLVLRNRHFERRWFAGRAVAESVKSMSWKYVMRAQPYDREAQSDTDALFLEDLKKTLDQASSLGGIDAELLSKPQISASMRTLRVLPYGERLDCYRRHRIENQRNWYATKSKSNGTNAQSFFGVVFIAHLAAIAASIATIVDPGLGFAAEAVLSAVAAAFLAWLQMRRYDELAQTYALAAQDLGLVEARASSVTTDQELADFVSDAENAISREHAMWLARRETR